MTQACLLRVGSVLQVVTSTTDMYHQTTECSRTDLALRHFRQLHRLVTEHLQHVTSLQVHPHQRRHLKINTRKKRLKTKSENISKNISKSEKKHVHQFLLHHKQDNRQKE
jgi:hypothetical protein